MTWVRIRAIFTDLPEDWSFAASICADTGCPSSQTFDNPPAIETCLENVPGVDLAIKTLTEGLARAGASSVVISEFPDEEWTDLIRQFFVGRAVGNTLAIAPTWAPVEFPGKVVITLDPGQAFGTGDHPTTRMCLELIEKEEPAHKRLLDLGCGSGILAIGAVKLGASKVVGLDIEPLSVEIAKANSALNEVDIDFRCGPGFSALEKGSQFEIIVSNIISAVLIALAPDVVEWLAPGGTWIVSGIIEANWPDVVKAAERTGFVLLDEMHEDGWVGASFKRN